MHARLLPIALTAVFAFAGPGCKNKNADPYGNGGTGWGADGAGGWGNGGWGEGGNVTELPARDERYSWESGNVQRGAFSHVYFGFDRFDIAPAERGKVQQVASYLRQNSGKSLLIAGFTDSIGTAEYNRALGERRAQAVRSALIGLGIPGDRVQTLSFGEDLPADPGNHAANRRAEFGLY
ncbi:MAG: OmpA family protein [Verrucomicrobiales bacterium]